MIAILWVILAALAILLAVILIRTATFRPRAATPVSEETVVFDRDHAIDALQKLVRCKTVSYYDPALEDDGEFEKLIGLLPTLYPEVFRVC